MLDLNGLLFALPISAWVGAILLVNEVPDISADRANGKHTLPVRIGPAATARLYLGLQVMAAAFIIGMSAFGLLALVAPLVPLALLALAAKSARAIRRGVDDAPGLRGAIENTLAIHTVGSLWLIAVVLSGAYAGS